MSELVYTGVCIESLLLLILALPAPLKSEHFNGKRVIFSTCKTILFVQVIKYFHNTSVSTKADRIRFRYFYKFKDFAVQAASSVAQNFLSGVAYVYYGELYNFIADQFWQLAGSFRTSIIYNILCLCSLKFYSLDTL